MTKLRKLLTNVIDGGKTCSSNGNTYNSGDVWYEEGNCVKCHCTSMGFASCHVICRSKPEAGDGAKPVRGIVKDLFS